jgi:predicted NBD/HSP70 family sugar kinase
MESEQPASSRRHRTKEQVTALIRQGPPPTRADLGQVTGLSRSAVAAVVQELLDEGVIEEDLIPPGGRGSGRGRPSAMLVPSTPRGHVVAMDFGHNHVAVAVADAEGHVIAERWTHLDVDGRAQASLDSAVEIVGALLDDAGVAASDIRCAAAGIPAPIDSRTHEIRSMSIMSDWVGVNPQVELSRLLGWRVVVANDADMGAQGELRYGAARGIRDLVYVKLGDGVGASLILQGLPYPGVDGLAGEVGHTQVSDQGDWCRCGNRGCLETVASSTFVHSLMADAGLTPHDDAFPLRDAAEHPAVARFVEESGRTVGRVLADLCNWLNPRRIIIGGELSTVGSPLAEGVRESIRRYTQPAIAQSVEVRIAELGRRSELLGCVAVACRELSYQPWGRPQVVTG